MKKTVLLSVVTATILCANDTIALEQVVTVGSKSEKRLQESTGSIELISNDTITNSGATTLGEVFENSSIYVSPGGSNLSIRGTGHNDTLFLIDSKRILGEFSKTYELQRIPAGMIERVEVLKGSASMLYGSDALGGVVNIITKKPKQSFSGTINAVGGKLKEAIDIDIGGFNANTTYSLFMNYVQTKAYEENEPTAIKVMQSGNERAPSQLVGGGNWALLKSALKDAYDYDIDYRPKSKLKNIGTKIGHFVNDWLELSFDATYLKEDKTSRFINQMYPTNYVQGANTIKAKWVPAVQEDDNERYALGGGIVFIPANDLRLQYDVHYSKYKKKREIFTPLFAQLGYASKEASLSGENYSTLTQTTHELNLRYDVNDDSKVFTGANYVKDDVDSSAYAKTINKKSLFAMHEWSASEKFDVNYGIRYDDTSIGKSQTSVSIGTRYEVLPNTHLRASYAQGFKSPDTRDLFVDQINPAGKYMLGSTVTNTHKTTSSVLKPETSHTYEVGILHYGKNYRIDTALFQSDIKNKIERVEYTSQSTPGVSYMTFENVNKSKIQGIETALSYRFFDGFNTKIAYTYTDARNKTDKTRIAYTPRQVASLNLDMKIADRLVFKTTTKYSGDQSGSDGQNYGGYTITNVKLSYAAMEALDVYGGVDNVFEKQTHKDLGLSPKAAYYVGMRYKF
jgi:outer membrane receptor for ferrienterochelin and colicins